MPFLFYLYTCVHFPGDLQDLVWTTLDLRAPIQVRKLIWSFFFPPSTVFIMVSHFILNFSKTGAQYPQGYFTNNCTEIHFPFQVMVGQDVLHVPSSWVPKLTHNIVITRVGQVPALVHKKHQLPFQLVRTGSDFVVQNQNQILFF